MRKGRTIDERAADAAVLKALSERGGTATVADVVVASALPESTVERALERALLHYDSRVSVVEGGALVYRFETGPGGRLRPRREQRVVLRAFLRTLAVAVHEVTLAVRAAFRAVLALQLLVYTFVILAPVSAVIGAVFGIIAGIVLVIGSIAGGDASLVELLLDPYVFAIFMAGAAVWGIYKGLKTQGDLLLALVGRDPKGDGRVGGFILQVNAFALGPARPPALRERLDRTWTISQADERRVLTRVRAAGGRLRSADLVSWLGLTYAEADRQAARLSAEYDGEPAAFDPGDEKSLQILEFHFPELLDTAGAATLPEAEPRTAFERGVPKPRLTGNRAAHDAAICGFAALNAIAGSVGLHFLDRPGAWWTLAYSAGGVLPVGFAALLVGLFVLRVPGHRWALWRAGRAQERTAILLEIIGHARTRGDAPVTLAQIGQRAGAALVAPPPRPRVQRLAAELEGSFDLERPDDPQGTTWRFPRLAAELRDRPKERPALRRAGRVLFDG